MKPKKNLTDNEQLNAFVDGELDKERSELLLARMDDDPELRGELCDIHRVKDLLNASYPLNPAKENGLSNNKISYGAFAASFLMMLSLGFVGGYFSSNFSNDESSIALKDSAEMDSNDLIQVSNFQEVSANKVIIYLGSSKKEKFDQTLDKAESLLEKYRKDGTEVYVVTSAGGIDLLRTSSSDGVQQRIKKMKGLYKSLHFVACNNQIYHLHKKGQPVNLVDEVEVAPSAVQFVVDHLKKGWGYIAI